MILTFRSCLAFDLLISRATLLRDRYPPCGDIDFHIQSRVCEIITEEDEMKIERFGLSGCYGSTLSCAEGDIKTCMPLVTLNILHYQCFCHMPDDVSPVVSDYHWTGWRKLSKHFRGFIYKRKLMINNGSDYVADEYSRIMVDVPYVVADNSLPDSVFTASSYWQYVDRTSPKRARIDNYFDVACCWASDAPYDTAPWLKISLPGHYEVMGVHIRQRCDYVPQYPTIVDVSTSMDDVSWQGVLMGEDIATRYSSYDGDGTVNVWFSRKYTTRYWKIDIVASHSHSSMKCDLIGNGIDEN